MPETYISISSHPSHFKECMWNLSSKVFCVMLFPGTDEVSSGQGSDRLSLKAGRLTLLTVN